MGGPLPCRGGLERDELQQFLAADVGRGKGEYICSWFGPHPAPGSPESPHRRRRGTRALQDPAGRPLPRPPRCWLGPRPFPRPSQCGAWMLPAPPSSPPATSESLRGGEVSRGRVTFVTCRGGSRRSWHPHAQGAAQEGRRWGRRVERDEGRCEWVES